MLCYRCENRARHLEMAARGKHCQPRIECGDVHSSKAACYMFQPCRPVLTVPLDAGDPRPRFAGAMLAKRERAVRVMDPQTDGIALDTIEGDKDEVALVWQKTGEED